MPDWSGKGMVRKIGIPEAISPLRCVNYGKLLSLQVSFFLFFLKIRDNTTSLIWFLGGLNEIKSLHSECIQKDPFRFGFPETLNVEELLNNRFTLYSTRACQSNAEFCVFIDY